MGWPEERSVVEYGRDGGLFCSGDRGSESGISAELDAAEIAVVVLSAPSDALEDLLPLVGEALAAISSVQPGQVVWVGRDRGGER